MIYKLLFMLVVGVSCSPSVWAQTNAAQKTDDWTAEKLLEAAQKEKVADVRAALEAGVDVNSKTEYGATALFFACDRGNMELVKLLLNAGADPNLKDTFYNSTPVTWAQQNQHQDIVVELLANGGEGADRFLIDGDLNE
jgi:ankyrin repeat protein